MRSEEDTMNSKEKVVVVGVDFGACGDAALSEGLRQLASGAARVLHVMHVLDPRGIVEDPERSALESEADQLERTPRLLMRRAHELAAMFGLQLGADRVRTHARLGDPVETLLQTCVDYDADLLVVGTHGRKGLDRWLLGSVAESLIRKARCPVLIARDKDYAGMSKTELPAPPLPAGESARAPLADDAQGFASTTIGSWHPSDNGPTGFRIV
jgi:universal stress protein A